MTRTIPAGLCSVDVIIGYRKYGHYSINFACTVMQYSDERDFDYFTSKLYCFFCFCVHSRRL